MIETYKALRDLIDEKLNNNNYGVVFNTTLFDSKKISYTKKVFSSEVDSYEVIKKKCVPAHIEEIVGGYVNVPNLSAVNSQIGLTLDLFTKEYTDLETPQLQELFESVSYTNSLLAIDELRKDLLAKFFPLGDVGIYFGGTDSVSNFEYANQFKFNTIYMELDIKDTDSGTIYKSEVDASNFIEITKSSGFITLTIVTGGSVKVVAQPYTTGLNTVWAFYDAIDQWNLVVNGSSSLILDVVTQNSYTSGSISPNKDYFGLVYRLLIDDGIITLDDTLKDVGEVVLSPLVDFRDFETRYELNQLGELVLTTNEIVDSILWGKDGNVVFGFETPVPISDLRFQDEGQPRQMYALGISCLISFDVLFGNLYDYYLDGTQIYPVDRQHTYGANAGSEQYIEESFSKAIISSNGKDKTQTFFVKPSKLITGLSKQLTSNTIEQNKEYTLVVQYPFYKETYSVIVDSGGINTNLNQLSTLTVTYKQRDDNIV